MKLGDLEALQGVVKFPVRIKCATLAWYTLLDALEQQTRTRMTPLFDEITPLPDDVDELELIHERVVHRRAPTARATTSSLLRGAVRDQKPPGLYLAEDPDPLTIHHMVVDLYVQIPSLEIVDANVAFEMHPHGICPTIAENYRALIGLSIARGFINKVREMFGGPRGCTHTTALLQAMAPVAIQSMWSFQMRQARAAGADGGQSPFSTPEGRERSLMMNLNTCHVWAEDGDQVAAIRDGRPPEIPVWIQQRFEKLGLDPAAWRNGGAAGS